MTRRAASRRVSLQIQPPRTELEQAVTEAFAVALGVDRVSVNANFFELGGHSLLAIRLWARLNEMFQVELPLRSFVELATPEAVALAIEEVVLDEIEALEANQAESFQESDA